MLKESGRPLQMRDVWNRPSSCPSMWMQSLWKSSSTTRSLMDILRRSPPNPLQGPKLSPGSEWIGAPFHRRRRAPRSPNSRDWCSSLSPDDDDFRKASGTTRWMRPRADFLDGRLSKLLKLLFNFVQVSLCCCFCFRILWDACASSTPRHGDVHGRESFIV